VLSLPPAMAAAAAGARDDDDDLAAALGAMASCAFAFLVASMVSELGERHKKSSLGAT